MKTFTTFFSLAFIYLGIFGFVKNANAQLDSTFGNNGLIFTPLDSNKINSSASLVQADGKIVIAGSASDLSGLRDFTYLKKGIAYVVRYNLNGSLDSSFGVNGVVTDSNWIFLSSLTQLSNGNLLIGGSKTIARNISGTISDVADPTIMAIKSDGSVDTTFGNLGFNILDLHLNYANIGYSSSGIARINYLEELSSGKILAYGSARGGIPGFGGAPPMAFVARMYVNGLMDSTFVDSSLWQFNGIILFDPYANGNKGIKGINDVISDGATRYLLGSSDFFSQGSIWTPYAEYHTFLTLAKLDTAGQIDSSFNFSNSQGLRATSYAFQGSKILCAGFYSGDLLTNPDSSSPYFAVQRYNQNGSIDTTFGQRDSLAPSQIYYRALTWIDSNSIVTDMYVMDDSSFLLVGVSNSQLTIARYLANGELDSICYNPIYRGNSLEYTAGLYVEKTPQIIRVKDNRILIASINKQNGLYGFQLSQYKLEKESKLKDTAVCAYSFAGSTYTSSGIYFDTLSTSLGCDSLIRLDLTINQIDTTVNQNGTTLSANAQNASYQWIDCNTMQPLLGDTNQSFSYSQSGSYAVVLSKNGCSDTSNCIMVNTVGLEELQTASFNIYPNPTSGIVNLEITNVESNQTLQIYNQMGQMIREERINEGKNQIDLSNFSKGIYFLQFEGEQHKLILY